MEDIRIDGLTADEWENLSNPQQPTDKDLTGLGVLEQPQKPTEEPQQSEAQPQLAQREDYENLGYWQTVGDEFMAAGVEASKFFMPKSKELNYTPRTKAGETYQHLVKYLYGIGGLLTGGEFAAGAKAIATARGMAGAAKTASVAESVLKGNKFFKTGKGGAKALGVKGLNILTQGTLQGAILDATIHSEDEGRLADMFGETDNKLVSWLQTDPNDSTAENKLKNVVEGAVFAMGLNGVVEVASPLVRGMFKGIKALRRADIKPEEAATIVEDIVNKQNKLAKVADTSELVEQVKAIRQEAQETGQEASQMIVDRFDPQDIEAAHKVLGILDEGEDIFIHSDGKFDIKVSNWEDAFKVSKDEYKKQLDALDVANGAEYAGDTALLQQDDAIRSTWTNRGWIGENEALTQTNANRIIKNYKDKFQIDNNIKVEFVDGLSINGKAVDGNTNATKFLGKVSKSKQNAIDKKALQVQKLKDKVTMLEGGNEPVMEALDAAKEELRIAQNELKELKSTVKGNNLKPNITIQIDKNAKNPYATLRAEIEHARDIAKGEVPDQSIQHFSRYEGINEGEAAVDYTYKKSVGRNKALNPESVVEQEVKEVPIEEPNQLKIDFDNHINQAKSVDDLVNGSVVADTIEDIDKTINKTIELSPEISGTTWEAISKDADKYADFLIKADEMGMGDVLQEAISAKDIERMNQITRKVLGIQKYQSALADKLAMLGENPPFEQMANIIDSIDQIARYTKETGTASGQMLQARSLINKAAQIFGSLRLSEATKAGISSISDILSVDVKNICDLNFTRGIKLTPEEIKAELMGKWLQNTDNSFVQMLINDKEIAAKFDEILTKAIQRNGRVDFNKELTRAVMEADYKDVYRATQLTDNPENKAKVIKNWVDKQGGLTSYYVHNLLSGVGTLAKNVISGGINTIYFPAKKIVAGYLGGGSPLSREGWNTYKSMVASWKESWDMCKAAFLNGDGKLSMMRDTMAIGEDEVFTGFREWKFDFSTPEGIWHAVQNFHSLMTRAMGASDELMSQLNYRSIKRAKTIEQAKQLADKYGITDEAVISKIEDNLFDNAFDAAGRPMDVETLAEAKDILYQLPLNGQMFDRATGDMVQVRPQSWVTGLAGSLNTAAASNPLLKIMFPFVKTGANILQMSLEHNGIYAMLSKNQRELLLSQTREGALARSQVAFGMFSLMSGCMMALGGMITGSAPTDANEKKALFATGWKPYSIRMGNKYVSYQGYEPLETILGFAADTVNIYGSIVNSEDEAKWQKFSQRMISSLLNNFLDKAAFRTGLRQMAYLTSPDENGADYAKALSQTAQGFLPDSSFIRNVSSVGKRDVTKPQGYERILSNYFNRGLGDYRRDAFGNRQDNYGLIVTNAGDDNSDKPEYAELENLAQYGFNPSEITKTITGTKLQYKEFKNPQTGRSVYDTMQEELSTLEIGGKTLQEAVRELVTSQEYDDLPLGVDMNGYKFSRSDDTKLNAIRDIFTEYNDEALINVINEHGDEYFDKQGRTMSEATEEVNTNKLLQLNDLY